MEPDEERDGRGEALGERDGLLAPDAERDRTSENDGVDVSDGICENGEGVVVKDVIADVVTLRDTERVRQGDDDAQELGTRLMERCAEGERDEEGLRDPETDVHALVL